MQVVCVFVYDPIVAAGEAFPDSARLGPEPVSPLLPNFV